jgi:putative hydrolase of the HAD superfamily
MVVVFDLDDTLYDEVEFVKSGLRAVAGYLQNETYYDFMTDVFQEEGSGKVFNKLLQAYNISIPLNKLIEVYRFHEPDIILPIQSEKILKFAQRYKTALISDGNYKMQQKKFDALGLAKYIEYPILTDLYHTEKPALKPYEMIMRQFKDEDTFVYVADNPKKDFIAAEKLGWKGIRYKNPVGIYKQFKSNTTYEVEDRKEIINLLKVIENEKK